MVALENTGVITCHWFKAGKMNGLFIFGSGDHSPKYICSD